MKYVVTGGAGHITKPLAEKLLAAGHEVTVIGRDAAKLQSLVEKGAKAAVGSVEDPSFLTTAFAGADAVYLMIPPNFGVTDWLGYQKKVADYFVQAVKPNQIKKVVVLSSVGAHMRKGAGPVDGLAYLEQQLENAGTDNKFLRPSYFYYNLFGQIPLIKGMGIMGANMGSPDTKLVLTHTSEIADAAAEELLSLSFTGSSVRYIASDERSTIEIANVLGNAIGKESLQWIPFSDEQMKGGLLQAGLAEVFAQGYTEMGIALRSGEMEADYWNNRPAKLGNIKLEDFAKEFAAVFNAS
ncbi:NAD(P)H-binding protein [Lacibacter sp. MH-610]|uniref:NAD(P)H-binding protein n=1 Tax=Lacibacter sp. MH-610 TaxID=3020883 RepID=UPI00389199AC